MTDTYFDRRLLRVDDDAIVNELWSRPQQPPTSAIDAPPYNCVRVNHEWVSYVLAAIETLAKLGAWDGVQDERDTVIQEVQKLMSNLVNGGACVTCSDVEKCQSVIDLSVSLTLNFEVDAERYGEELLNQYDGTPQSVGDDIPTTAPSGDADAETALCNSLWRWLRAFCLMKAARLRQKTSFANVRNVIDFAQVTTGTIRAGTMFVVNLFRPSTVTDAEAIAALEDEDAIDAVACAIYTDMLSQVAGETNLITAVDALSFVAGTNEAIIAEMAKDGIAGTLGAVLWMAAYDESIERQNNGAVLLCPCKDVWIEEFDFEASSGGWVAVKDGNGNPRSQWVAGLGWHLSPQNTDPDNFQIAIAMPSLADVNGFEVKLSQVIPNGNRQFGLQGASTIASDASVVGFWQNSTTVFDDRTTDQTTVHTARFSEVVTGSLRALVRIAAGGGTGSPDTYITRIQVSGTGVNPFD